MKHAAVNYKWQDIRSSEFDVRCSMFDVACTTLATQPRAERCELPITRHQKNTCALNTQSI
jgi:hypothetical protein